MFLGGKIMIINNTYKKHVIKWLNEKKPYVKESIYANYSYIVFLMLEIIMLKN